MSWREVARRVRSRECADEGLDALEAPEAANDYARAEREAIAIADGGLPVAWASALYAIEHGPRPALVSDAEWRAALDHVWRRASECGAEFVANGWTFEEVFGVGAHWARLDQRGAAWLGLSCRIVSIDDRRIVFERGDKRSTHYKPGRLH